MQPDHHATTADFLADESFLAFALGHPDDGAATTQRWLQWQARHPRHPAFAEAMAVVQQLRLVRRPVPAGLKDDEAARLWRFIHHPEAHPRPHRPGSQPWLRSRRSRRWAAALGAAGLAVGGAWLWWRPLPRPVAAAAWATVSTRLGEHRYLKLPDSSAVVLNAGSSLRWAAAWQPGQPRDVWLTGEAYFEVRHAAAARRPAGAGGGAGGGAAAPAGARFTVHAGALEVAVLGTRFDVLHRPGRTQVVLNAGQVQLTRRAPNGQVERVLMRPGELVAYAAAARQPALTRRQVRAAHYSAWTSGQLDFDNTPVADIVALLEDTYDLTIDVKRPALLRQRLTGTVPNQDVDVLLAALGKSLEVGVRRNGRHVQFD